MNPQNRTPRSTPAGRLLAPAAAALSLCAALPAQAQNITIYGLYDLAVEHVSHVGPTAGGLTRMPSLTGSVPSRLGLRGSEDLGGGLRAVMTIEQGIAADQGTLNQGGRGWGRQAWVGLAGPWGTLSLGRQYTMLFWSILDTDIMGPALYGSGSLDAYIPNARADNAFAWRGSFSGFTLGATYSLGRDAVNAGPSPAGTNCAGENAADTKACREWSVLLKYDTPQWGFALAQDTIRGGAGAFAGLTSSGMKDTRTVANGYVKVGSVKLAAGLIQRDNGAVSTTPKSNLWYAGASWLATPLLTLEGEWLTLRTLNAGGHATLQALRSTYDLSKRTAVYASYGHIGNGPGMAISVSAGAAGSNPLPGTSQNAFAAGVKHAF